MKSERAQLALSDQPGRVCVCVCFSHLHEFYHISHSHQDISQELEEAMSFQKEDVTEAAVDQPPTSNLFATLLMVQVLKKCHPLRNSFHFVM